MACSQDKFGWIRSIGWHVHRISLAGSDLLGGMDGISLAGSDLLGGMTWDKFIWT